MAGIRKQPFRTPLRVRYFEGQLLTAQDFQDEQQYQLEKCRLHNRLLHGTGIVTGLQVGVVEGTTVQVTPGVAIDPLGREVIVPTLHRTDAAQPTSDEGEPERDRIVKGEVNLCVGYRELGVEARPLPAGDEDVPTRIAEAYRLIVSPESSLGSDDVVLLATIRVEGESIKVHRLDRPRRKHL